MHHHQGQGSCCGPNFGHEDCFPPHIFKGIGMEILKMCSPENWETFMPYELGETDQEYIVTMLLPGFESKDIEVSAKGDNILIEAKRELPTPDQGQEKINIHHSMGRQFWDKSHVEVLIPIGENIDQENVNARLARGLLIVRFKKKPGKKINVEVQ